MPSSGPAARVLDDTGRLVSPTVKNRPSGEPISNPVPRLDELKGTSSADLWSVLSRFGVVDSWDQRIADAMAYVNSVAKIPTDSPRFDQELERVLSPWIGGEENRRGLLGFARDTVREWTTQTLVADGNPSTEYVRISEGDEHVCESCADLGGSVGTYAQHVSAGLPGAASCYGGSYCRCVLVEID